MKAAYIESYGNAEQIKIGEFKVPEVLEDEILVEIHASSINPIDWKVREGKAKALFKYNFPFILGNDCSGIVKKIGKNVTKFKVGDEVYSRPDKLRIGTFAEFISLKEYETAHKPKNISLLEASSLPLVALTSWQALVIIGKLNKGDSVLIHAGSGGVGSIAIQLAKALGLKVATTTSTTNVEFVKSLGADIVIDYKKEKFQDILKDYDFVFDTLGGETLIESFKVLKKNGVIVSISSAPDVKTAKRFKANLIVQFVLHLMNFNLRKLIKKYGVRYEYLMMHSDGDQLKEFTTLVESGKVKPIIDKDFKLDEIIQAFQYQELGRTKGKVVIKIKE
ncbi:MAG: NADP-dependent oxidoreductase [Leptospiraceae bacterium]|nr:NADP-dependent oxidoreductase [Leptospiraceae bacterium]